MRQVLLRIWLEHPWAGPTEVQGLPHVGACWVLLGLIFAWLAFHLLRKDFAALRDRAQWLTWGVGLLAVSVQPAFGALPESFPVFGYGFMMLIGFTSATWFCFSRARYVGLNPDVIVDAAVWILLLGIAGGRAAYLIQYRHLAFADVNTVGEFLLEVINLPSGGLVQIGGLAGGTFGFWLYCRKNQVNFLEFADIIAPAIFIGIGFGRIGCLLNGCCYGDRCELPWGIHFPAGSTTFLQLVDRGFVDEHASQTFALHPTQIYSSINGFVLALVTGVYYWYRKHAGDVFALGCLLYAVTRVQIEFLRADEMGQLGTSFTISQFYSLGITLLGILLLYANRRTHGHNTLTR